MRISPNPGGQSSGDPGREWIDSGRHDFVDYAITVLPTYVTVPTGYTLPAFARAEAERLSTASGGGLMHRVNIERHFETAARCLWIDRWLEADSADDPAVLKRATAALVSSATWKATVQTDGGGIVRQYQKLGREAGRGDRAAIKAAFAYDSCRTTLAVNGR